MSALKHTPHFTVSDAKDIAKQFYGIDVLASTLPSDRDQNFLLTTGANERFILKLANGLDSKDLLQAQQEAIISAGESLKICPQIIPTLEHQNLMEIQTQDGSIHWGWMVTYLSGGVMSARKRHTPELLFELGSVVSQIGQALSGFEHQALHRTLDWDLANGLDVIANNLSLVADNEMRQLIVQNAADFERDVVPLLSGLRKSVIHNDINDHNILVSDVSDSGRGIQTITGLIDFGDIVHSYTVCNLAIAIAYAVLDKSDPLMVATQIVKGYHSIHPLTEDEISALFGFIRLRLCVSVCMSANQQRIRPKDEYLSISQQPIIRTLPKLAKIPARLAEAIFRDACGLIPVKSSNNVCNWLLENASTFSSPIDPDLRTTPLHILDLGITKSPINKNHDSNVELTTEVFRQMKLSKAHIGIGRYDEPRLLYTSPEFACGESPFGEYRTIHLGIDVFALEGTKVFAPIKGRIHSFNNNDKPLDYGPIIILKHETDDGHSFYTLYGHLGLESLEGLHIGQEIAQGECFATIGGPPINGNWPSHLHFQLITDLLDLDCEFPGVGRASQREIWRSFSPDPNIILGISAQSFPPPEPDKYDTLSTRRQRIGKNLSVAYSDPVKIVRGSMQYLYDENGRKYLDAYNNVPHVGHCHPFVVNAGQQQMATLNTNTRYLHDLINQYAERLCSTLPSRLSVCYFLNSASEANELALRMARAFTKQRDMIVLEAAYHGHTTSLIDISPYKHEGPGGFGAPSWVHKTLLPDCYRGLYKSDDPEAAEKYAQHVSTIIDGINEQGRGIAGFIAETCPSVGGQIFLPDKYLPLVYNKVREAGGICIADEVQTGYGRIGNYFWAFEEHGVEPDIVVMGKPIGNGHPIGALVTTPEIAAAFDNGMEFFSTFGGNPVSCAIGLAVLDVMFEERLQEHALHCGERLLTGLHRLADQYSIIGDVRGSGLFLGIELVKDRKTLEPATEETSIIVNRMRDHGILMGVDGHLHNVVKIRPPMQFTESDADILLQAMAQSLDEV